MRLTGDIYGDGVLIGEARGFKKSSTRTARILIKRNFSLEDVSEISGLSSAEVMELKQSLVAS